MNMRTESKEKKEYVLFVLDESGSMESCKKATIDGFNEQLQELKKTSDIKTLVSLVKFSSDVQTVFWNKPLEEVDELSNETYSPNGMTAMLDAVGQGVSRLRNDTPTDTDDVSFLVIIVSDGAENSSREYTEESVANIITKCKEDKAWTITYMGANQDLSEVSKSLNIPMGNMMLYANSSTGTQLAFNNMSTGVANYRNARSVMTSDQLAASGIVGSFYSSIGASIDDTRTTS